MGSLAGNVSSKAASSRWSRRSACCPGSDWPLRLWLVCAWHLWPHREHCGRAGCQGWVPRQQIRNGCARKCGDQQHKAPAPHRVAGALAVTAYVEALAVIVAGTCLCRCTFAGAGGDRLVAAQPVEGPQTMHARIDVAPETVVADEAGIGAGREAEKRRGQGERGETRTWTSWRSLPGDKCVICKTTKKRLDCRMLAAPIVQSS